MSVQELLTAPRDLGKRLLCCNTISTPGLSTPSDAHLSEATTFRPTHTENVRGLPASSGQNRPESLKPFCLKPFVATFGQTMCGNFRANLGRARVNLCRIGAYFCRNHGDIGQHRAVSNQQRANIE